MQKELITIFTFIALDYLSGVCVGIKNKKVTSSYTLLGLKKHFVMFIIVGIVIVESSYFGYGAISAMIIPMFGYPYAISFLANLRVLGFWLPKSLETLLENEIAKKDKNNNGIPDTEEQEGLDVGS